MRGHREGSRNYQMNQRRNPVSSSSYLYLSKTIIDSLPVSRKFNSIPCKLPVFTAILLLWNWTSLPICGFTAQLVKQCTSIAEVTGLNLIEALVFFGLLPSNFLNWKIYCDHHSSLSERIKQGEIRREVYGFLVHVLSLCPCFVPTQIIISMERGEQDDLLWCNKEMKGYCWDSFLGRKF